MPHSHFIVLALFLLTTFGDSHRLGASRMSQVAVSYRIQARTLRCWTEWGISGAGGSPATLWPPCSIRSCRGCGIHSNRR